MITVDDISVEVLLLTFIYLIACSTYVHAPNNTINVNPYPIVLNIPLSQTQEPIQKGLFITSGDNITKVQAYFTDLETTEEGKIWISKNSIRLIPKIFNVTSLRGTEANLLLDIHNHTGFTKVR